MRNIPNHQDNENETVKAFGKSIRKAMSIFRFVILSFLFLAWLPPCVGQRGADSKMQWSAKPTKSHFKHGEEVTLFYTLRNDSTAKRIVASSPAIGSEISLQLAGPDGNNIVWQGAVYSSKGTPGVVDMILLFPSRAISGTTAVPISCNPVGQGGFCLDKPGKYTATAIYKTWTFGITECSAPVAAGPYRSEQFEFWID